MIILPDKNIPKSKILLPVQKKMWRQSSQRSGLFQIENNIIFKVSAKLNDGYTVWRGWFHDRNDADEFLFSLINGSLPFERKIWDTFDETWHHIHGFSKLGWRPDLGENLHYDFHVQTFLTHTSFENQKYIIY